MNLRQIEVFRAVMLTGSMTDAAKLLHVSQPGVSRLIRHLEIQLGVALFERRNGRVVATAKARALYVEVENVYRGVHHLQDIASRLSYAENTMLRVIASASAGLEAVPRLQLSFWTRSQTSKFALNRCRPVRYPGSCCPRRLT